MPFSLPAKDVSDTRTRIDLEAIEGVLRILTNNEVNVGDTPLFLTFGGGTLTWPGGSQLSDIVQVTTGLPRQALVAFITSRDANVNVAQVPGLSPTQFPMQGKTVDGTSPVGSATTGVHWVALCR